MLENITKARPELAETMYEALDALRSVGEPYKTKIKTALNALDKVAEEMAIYKDVDSLMDDSASDLTLLSGVDVRKEGLHKALSKVIHSTDQARAIIDASNWLIAKSIKEYLNNE